MSFWLLRWLDGKDWTAEVEDAELCRCLAEKKQALKDAALSSPLGRARPAGPELHRRSRSTCCCCRTPLLGWAAAGNMCMFACICIFVVLECAPTQHLPSTSLSVACLPVRKRNRCSCHYICLGRCPGGGLAGGTTVAWLSRDLLALSRIFCAISVWGAMWPTVSDLRRNQSGMERSGSQLLPRSARPAGWAEQAKRAPAAAAEHLCW